jgi:hypothetical protein
VPAASRQLPHAALRAGASLRTAFVGQSTFFEACALPHPAGGLLPRFFEFRKGADVSTLRHGLEDFAPHVVVVFRPEILPPGALAGLGAARLGFLTEPIPRGTKASHPDLERRMSELREVDPSNVDRIVSFDPLIAETAGAILPVWRSLPLPVNDRYFLPVEPSIGPPRVLFVGRSTDHREHMLTPSKHSFDVLHMAFGVHAGRLEQALREHDVGINLHNEPYPSFENRVALHLAAGHLVISEPLSPNHGLEPGIDFIVASTPGQLHEAIERLHRFPGIYDRIRVRGRRKAEQFRASRVYPRLIADLLADLASERGAAA